MNLDIAGLVWLICGAGIVIFCESEYSCFRLFKRKTTLFFFICQLAILSSSLESALTFLVYFLINLRALPMIIIISIVQCIRNITYPIMILLRLRFVRNFSIIIMYIPVMLAIILTVPKYFWIRWILTNESYYQYIYYFIIFPISTCLLAAQNIVINIFFIVIAIKFFENIVHVKSTIIVNIIIIVLECLKLVIEFLVNDKWFLLFVTSVIAQIKVRLEIEILSYIVQSVYLLPHL
jgi:hypothetical protein